MDPKRQAAELLDALGSDNLDDRGTAIQILGEIGKLKRRIHVK
jgi:hypothetical protein